MQVMNISSPMCAVNGRGQMTVFLPPLVSEPKDPVVQPYMGNSVILIKNKKEACILSDLPVETMTAFQRASKCLVVEMEQGSASRRIEEGDHLSQDEEEITKAFTRLYEADIVLNPEKKK